MLALAFAASCALRAFAADVPFRWTPGQIEVAAMIDGKGPVWCIVDSGAEFSMIDAEVAKELGIDGASSTIKIGDVVLRDVPLRPWKLDNFRRQKRDIRGVIGCELFERNVVTIDFQRRVLVVQSSFAPGDKAVRFPIRFAGRLPVIDARLAFGERVLPVRLMIDTGASQAVILRHPFTTKHQLPMLKTTTEDSVAAGLRPFVTLAATRLHLGRWTWDHPNVSAYGTSAGAGGGTDTDGLLGNDVLRRFRVTFDYERRLVFLEETAR